MCVLLLWEGAIFTGDIWLSYECGCFCVDWMECKRRFSEKRGFSSFIHPFYIKVWWFKEMVSASIIWQSKLPYYFLNIWRDSRFHNFIHLHDQWLPSIVDWGWIIVLHLTLTVLLSCSYTYRACLEETEQYWRGWYE